MLFRSQIVKNNNNYDTNVVLIYGSDKPKPFLVDDELYFTFTDAGRTTYHPQVFEANFSYEQFCHSPTFPKLIIKQLHLLKKEMEINKSFYNMIKREKFLYSMEIRRLPSENLIHKILYPYWNNLTYQKSVKNQDDKTIQLLFNDKEKEKVDKILDIRSMEIGRAHV